LKEQTEVRAVLLSVAPRFATRIFAGMKTVELRKVPPKLMKGDLVLLYVTSPEKSLQGVLRVTGIKSGKPEELWEENKERVGLSHTEFKDYFNGTAIGCAISFDNIEQLDVPLSLATLRTLFPGFQPPQVHRYVSAEDLATLLGCAEYLGMDG
jgi:predicted transcriptional regulator